jgi:PilZ domain-containing protein
MALAISQVPVGERADRRASRRYPLYCDATFSLLERNRERRCVRVLNISAMGLLLECDPELSLGLEIEVTIPWPAQKGMHNRLNLHTVGKTVRCHGNRTAVRIDRSVFRFDG